MSNETRLELQHGEATCDGCDRDIAEGVLFIGGIESCCGGGCSRNLCADCVRQATEMLRAAEAARTSKAPA